MNQNNTNKLKLTAWLFIVLWLTRFLIFRILNIEFATIEFARNFRLVWLFIIPSAIGVLVYFSWKKRSNQKFLVNRIRSRVIASFLFVSFMSLLSCMCEWTFTGPIFKHNVENRVMVLRSLNCGAGSSSNDPYELVEIKSLGPYFVKYYPVDKTKMDTSKWH